MPPSPLTSLSVYSKNARKTTEKSTKQKPLRILWSKRTSVQRFDSKCTRFIWRRVAYATCTSCKGWRCRLTHTQAHLHFLCISFNLRLILLLMSLWCYFLVSNSIQYSTIRIDSVKELVFLGNNRMQLRRLMRACQCHSVRDFNKILINSSQLTNAK